MKREAKAAVAKAKNEAYKEWYDKMGTEAARGHTKRRATIGRLRGNGGSQSHTHIYIYNYIIFIL